ncbi:MAG: N-acetyltransferase [Planctomycetota bacterium]|nr:MAG: N-acetyltransferase [Planctomycetota bacterium]
MSDALALDTARLRLRELEPRDAAFLVELLNEPAFLRYIGDRGVRDEAGALGYVERARASYATHGHGLLLVERRADGEPLGICGLIRRDGLDAPDLGFALRAAHEGRGYALEAARAVLEHAARVLRIARVLAIFAHDNERSRRLLDRLEFQPAEGVRLPGDNVELCAFARELRAASL